MGMDTTGDDIYCKIDGNKVSEEEYNKKIESINWPVGFNLGVSHSPTVSINKDGFVIVKYN